MAFPSPVLLLKLLSLKHQIAPLGQLGKADMRRQVWPTKRLELPALLAQTVRQFAIKVGLLNKTKGTRLRAPTYRRQPAVGPARPAEIQRPVVARPPKTRRHIEAVHLVQKAGQVRPAAETRLF